MVVKEKVVEMRESAQLTDMRSSLYKYVMTFESAVQDVSLSLICLECCLQYHLGPRQNCVYMLMKEDIGQKLNAVVSTPLRRFLYAKY